MVLLACGSIIAVRIQIADSVLTHWNVVIVWPKTKFVVRISCDEINMISVAIR